MPVRPTREADVYVLRSLYGVGGVGTFYHLHRADSTTKRVTSSVVRYFGTPISAFFRKAKNVARMLETTFLVKRDGVDKARDKLSLDLVRGLFVPTSTVSRGKNLYYLKELYEAFEEDPVRFSTRTPLKLGKNKGARTLQGLTNVPVSVYTPYGQLPTSAGKTERAIRQDLPAVVYWSEREPVNTDLILPKLTIRNSRWVERDTESVVDLDVERLQCTLLNLTKDSLLTPPTEVKSIIEAEKGFTFDAVKAISDTSISLTTPKPVVSQQGYVRRVVEEMKVEWLNSQLPFNEFRSAPENIRFTFGATVGSVASKPSSPIRHALGSPEPSSGLGKFNPTHPGIVAATASTNLKEITRLQSRSIDWSHVTLFAENLAKDLGSDDYQPAEWQMGGSSSPWNFAIDYFASETSSMIPARRHLQRVDLFNPKMASQFRDFLWFKPVNAKNTFEGAWFEQGAGKGLIFELGDVDQSMGSVRYSSYREGWKWNNNLVGTEVPYPLIFSVRQMDLFDKYGKLLRYRLAGDLSRGSQPAIWNPILETNTYDFIIPCDSCIVTNYDKHSNGEMGTLTHHEDENFKNYGDYFIVEAGRETCGVSFLHVTPRSMKMYQFPYGVSSVHLKRDRNGLRILNELNTSYQGWVENKPYVEREISPNNPFDLNTYWFVKVLIASNFGIGLDRISTNRDSYKKHSFTPDSQFVHPGLNFFDYTEDLKRKSRGNGVHATYELLPEIKPMTEEVSKISNFSRGTERDRTAKMIDIQTGTPNRKWFVPAILDGKYTGVLFRGTGYEHYQNNRLYYKDLFGQNVQLFKLKGNSYIRNLGQLPVRPSPIPGINEQLQRPMKFELKGEAEAFLFRVGVFRNELIHVKLKDGFKWTNGGVFPYHLTNSTDMMERTTYDEENCIGINDGKWELLRNIGTNLQMPHYQFATSVLGSEELVRSAYYNETGYLYLKETEALWGEQPRAKPTRRVKNTDVNLNDLSVFYFRVSGKVRRFSITGNKEVITKSRDDFIRELPVLGKLYNQTYGEVEAHCAYPAIIFKNGSLSLTIPWISCHHGDEKVVSFNKPLTTFYRKHYDTVNTNIRHNRFDSAGYFRGALVSASRNRDFIERYVEMSWGRMETFDSADTAVFNFNNFRGQSVNDIAVPDLKLAISRYQNTGVVNCSLFKINVEEGITYISIRQPIRLKIDLDNSNGEVILFNIRSLRGKVIINVEAPIYIDTINGNDRRLDVQLFVLRRFGDDSTSSVEFINFEENKVIVNHSGSTSKTTYGVGDEIRNFY